MTTILADAALRDKLLGATGIAEIRDEAGDLIGRFLPAGHPDEEIKIALGQEELERRLSPNCKTYTTAEILAHLQELK